MRWRVQCRVQPRVLYIKQGIIPRFIMTIMTQVACSLPRPFGAALACLCISACDGQLDQQQHAADRGDAELDVGSTSAPVTRLIGEIHLHQFPLGSHAWAGFLANPMPLARAHPDQLVEYELAPTAKDGNCTLFQEPSCTPGCQPSSYCSATDTCSRFEPLRFVDAGEVAVVGSSVLPKLRMFFNGPESTYDTQPPAGTIQLFKGGDRLDIRGGTGAFAFSGSMPAPMPVKVIAPDLGKDLHLPLDGDLRVDWVSEESLSVALIITVSAHDGPLAYIRCNTADVGSLTVPRSMMAALPRPPRDTRFELERYEERVFATARPGVGIFVNAAQSTWANGSD